MPILDYSDLLLIYGSLQIEELPDQNPTSSPPSEGDLANPHSQSYFKAALPSEPLSIDRKDGTIEELPPTLSPPHRSVSEIQSIPDSQVRLVNYLVWSDDSFSVNFISP